jgi:hypothetical protein
MKEDKTTLLKKNPYQYNGESLHISPHENSTQSVDDEVVTKSKKFYIGSSHTL